MSVTLLTARTDPKARKTFVAMFLTSVGLQPNAKTGMAIKQISVPSILIGLTKDESTDQLRI
jgi:hypothetical protein